MLYFGPETYLPLASLFAGLVGVLMTFWRRVVGFFRRYLSRVARGSGDRSSRRSAAPRTLSSDRSSAPPPEP